MYEGSARAHTVLAYPAFNGVGTVLECTACGVVARTMQAIGREQVLELTSKHHEEIDAGPATL